MKKWLQNFTRCYRVFEILIYNRADKMLTENPKHIIFQHNYLIEIKERLSQKAQILNVSSIHRQTGISRRVIQQFMNGEIPSTSFENIVKLYAYIEEQNI